MLLRHTDRLTPACPAEHLACDAVINANIHRTLGPTASALMSRYYAKARGPCRLLRPPEDAERKDAWWDPRHCRGQERRLRAAWAGLYEGRLVADDIRDLARDLEAQDPRGRIAVGNGPWLGSHGGAPRGPEDRGPRREPTAAEEALRRALDAALKSMNGSGLFRGPHARGLGAAASWPTPREARAWPACWDTWRARGRKRPSS